MVKTIVLGYFYPNLSLLAITSEPEVLEYQSNLKILGF